MSVEAHQPTPSRELNAQRARECRGLDRAQAIAHSRARIRTGLAASRSSSTVADRIVDRRGQDRAAERVPSRIRTSPVGVEQDQPKPDILPYHSLQCEVA